MMMKDVDWMRVFTAPLWVPVWLVVYFIGAAIGTVCNAFGHGFSNWK
jgi:hypothetical protein